MNPGAAETPLDILRDALPALRLAAEQECAAEHFRLRQPMPGRWAQTGRSKRDLFERAKKALSGSKP